MSKETKRKLAGGMVLAVVVTLAAVSLFANPFWSKGAAPPVREIVLEARDLAFGGDNPTLQLSPGERVRLVVRNNDPGILHSIALPGIDSTVRTIKWGEEVAFEITVPDGGTWEYVCPQHLPKMRGKIEVVPQS
jgi:plastocyanin